MDKSYYVLSVCYTPDALFMFLKILNVTFGIFGLGFGVKTHTVMSITSSTKNLVTIGLVVVCRSLIIFFCIYYFASLLSPSL